MQKLLIAVMFAAVAAVYAQEGTTPAAMPTKDNNPHMAQGQMNTRMMERRQEMTENRKEMTEKRMEKREHALERINEHLKKIEEMEQKLSQRKAKLM